MKTYRDWRVLSAVILLYVASSCDSQGPSLAGLEWGMSEGDIVELTGEPPCEVLSWRGGRLLYFHRSDPLRPRGLCARKDSLAPTKIPWDGLPPAKYDHLEVLLSKSGFLVAETIVAESACVRTAKGPYPGISEVTSLPEDAYGQLVLE